MLVALLLAGLGLWQAWQCTDDMAPLLMPAAMAPDAVAHAHGDTGVLTPADDSGHGGLAAGCMSVLLAVAGALLLMDITTRLLAVLTRVGHVLPLRVPALPRAATLAQLCILRT
ncbi:hypothetical protein AB0B66_09880 [Catellatospora sp. NPDC049111]|uniref:hypothetical protein n=1 Tax=Catellatospora sp. NPDC049111 TaxID=3155271 RepID=UPI0033E41269